METQTQPSTIPPEVLADLQAISAAVSEGHKPDPELVKRIRERAEHARLEVFKRNGLLDIGVPAIREFRDR